MSKVIFPTSNNIEAYINNYIKCQKFNFGLNVSRQLSHSLRTPPFFRFNDEGLIDVFGDLLCVNNFGMRFTFGEDLKKKKVYIYYTIIIKSSWRGHFFFFNVFVTDASLRRESLNVSKQYFFPFQQPLRLLIRPVIATVVICAPPTSTSHPIRARVASGQTYEINIFFRRTKIEKHTNQPYTISRWRNSFTRIIIYKFLSMSRFT